MGIRSIKHAAFAIAVSISALAILCIVILHSAGIGAWRWYDIAAVAGVFIIVYLISYPITKELVISSIKPIYRTVLSRDVKTKELEKRLNRTDNLIKTVNDDIKEWAEGDLETIEQLKRNEIYRREFVGNVSHELKTPIFNIQGYITTLLDGGLRDTAVNNEYLERAEKNIDRLIDIVDDLEEITKLESSVMRLEKKDFDIVALSRFIIETVEFEAAEKNISVIVERHKPITVNADKRYVEQVLTNLIINSIHYGIEGGTTRISFTDIFEKIMVEVSDNGIGIAESDIPHVFERFYRSDKSRSRDKGGTGLGHAILKHIINAHNETITARSEEGKGSTFSFTLPKA